MPSPARGESIPERSVYDLLSQLASELGGARDPPTVYRALRAFVEALTPASGMFISRYDAQSHLRRCVFAYSEGAEEDVAALPPLPMTQSPHSRAVATGDVVVTDDFQRAIAASPAINVGLDRDPRLPESSIVVPLVHQGSVLGAFEIQSTTPAAFDAHHVAVLRLAANLAAIALENLRLQQDERERVAALERAVEVRTRELARTNKALEAFSYTVAHDLRAPLRAVEHLAETIGEDEPGLSADSRASLDAMGASVKRMSRLIEDLLKLARADQTDLAREDVDLAAVAEQIVAEMKEREPGRATRVRVQPGLRARADPGLARILLENLLANAWKYSRSKPGVAVEVGTEERDGQRAFYVRDEGVGFDATKKDRLFLPFSRLHPANEYEGTGIGLATVERIARRHGGKVWAEGAPGIGATFWFTLEP